MRLFAVRGHWKTMVRSAVHRSVIVGVGGIMSSVFDRIWLGIILRVIASGVVHRPRRRELLIAIWGARRSRGATPSGIAGVEWKGS